MSITKRNHSNPCFWTAMWNEEYYNKFITGQKTHSSRTQKVYSLNVKANKILYDIVDNIHYDKGIGISKMTPEDMNSFVKRHFPNRYKQFIKEMSSHPETLYLDSEDIFSRMEVSSAYTTLLKVIKTQRIETRDDKAEIAFFVFLQLIRSHAILNSMIELVQNDDIPKFEYFYLLKYFLSNPEYLKIMVTPIIFANWIIYITDNHTFPLPDTPIFTRNKNIMVALSPRILLEIDLRNQASEYSCLVKEGISTSKLNEYRKRCISNTFKEIIFNDNSTLEKWLISKEFRKRVKIISNKNSFNVMINENGNLELWKLNAFGNLD